MSDKLVYVIPRIRITSRQYGESLFSLGKATILPDEDSSWEEYIKKSRPLCLNVFRQFPYENDTSEMPISRGTLLISDDEDWLRNNVAYVVAVSYVLGVQENLWQHPSEAFQYYDIVVGDASHDLVKLHTKTNNMIEDASDFKLLPSLELRGSRDHFQINTRSDVFKEMSTRLDESEPDRLIVSCYHLFRTQYANAFLSPDRQDSAAYCASLEAAFDTPKSQDGGKTLANSVEEFYLGYKELRDFIRGLYEERSIFNHGVSEGALSEHRKELLSNFRETPYRWDLLRHICCDVIHEKARDAAGAPRGDVGKFFSKSFKMVQSCFSSKEAWESLCHELTKKGSVKKLLNLHQTGSNTEEDDAKLSEFIGLSCRFLLIHEWSQADVRSEANKACASLQCLAEIIHATSTDDSVKESAEMLYESAKDRKGESIKNWATEHAEWTMLSGYKDLTDSAQALSAHIAQLFEFC